MKIKKFNEADSEDIILTMDDVRSIKGNLGGRDNDPVKNFRWEETQTLKASAMPWNKPQDFNGKVITVLDLYTSPEEGSKYKYANHLGYALSIDDKIEYLVSIYEPHGFELLPERNLFVAHGHENIILLWLEDGKFNNFHTR